MQGNQRQEMKTLPNPISAAPSFSYIETATLQMLFDQIAELRDLVKTLTSDGYLNQQDAAEYLRMSVDTFARKEKRGQIKASHYGGLKRYKKSALDAAGLKTTTTAVVKPKPMRGTTGGR